MLSDNDSVSEEDAELNDTIMQLASIFSRKPARGSPNVFSVKPKCRSKFR